MGKLIIPGNPTPAPEEDWTGGRQVLSLEKGKGVAAAIISGASHPAILENPDQILILGAGSWMLVDSVLWSGMLQRLAQMQTKLDAKPSRARERHDKRRLRLVPN